MHHAWMAALILALGRRRSPSDRDTHPPTHAHTGALPPFQDSQRWAGAMCPRFGSFLLIRVEYYTSMVVVRYTHELLLLLLLLQLQLLPPPTNMRVFSWLG